MNSAVARSARSRTNLRTWVALVPFLELNLTKLANRPSTHKFPSKYGIQEIVYELHDKRHRTSLSTTPVVTLIPGIRHTQRLVASREERLAVRNLSIIY